METVWGNANYKVINAYVSYKRNSERNKNKHR